MKRTRFRQIMALALPIMGGMLSQNILNLIDTLMVAQLGATALAAVGMGGFASFLSSAFVTGMSTGVQAMASRRKGEGRIDQMATPINAGLVIVVALALPMTLVGVPLARSVFSFLVDDASVATLGTPYLQARLLGLLAIGSNFVFRGYWNGIGLSRVYLRTLLVMHASNVVISYVLIFGVLGLPALGATGAGIGTTVSMYIGTGYYILLAWRHARSHGFLRERPSRQLLRSILRISVPAALQTLLFAGGLTTQFMIVSRIGTAELAAASVLVNITLFAILPGLALGLACASFVGQALGRGDVDDAVRWGWDVVRVGVLVMGLIGVPMWLAPDTVLRPFLEDSGPRMLAVPALVLVGATIALDGFGMVLLQAMGGAGATRLSMAISVLFQWGIFLPCAYVVGLRWGLGLTGVWAAQVGYRCLQSALCALLWHRRTWAHVRL